MAKDKQRKSSGPRSDTAGFVQMLEDHRWELSQRRRKEFTKAEYAAYLGIAKQTLAGWYDGARPRPDLIWQVADVTGLDAHALFAGAGYPNTPYRPKSILDAAKEAAEAHPEGERERLLEFARELFARYEAGRRGAGQEESGTSEHPRQRVSAG